MHDILQIVHRNDALRVYNVRKPVSFRREIRNADSLMCLCVRDTHSQSAACFSVGFVVFFIQNRTACRKAKAAEPNASNSLKTQAITSKINS